MNYRHAFHAGNVADCLKHALLIWLLRALARKEAGFAVLDTHAGAGRYDLEAGPAERTGEWRAGIGRLLDEPPDALGDYVRIVRSLGLYPGSPALIRALLRPQDRLACLRAASRGRRRAAPAVRARPRRWRCITATAGRRWGRCCRRRSGAAWC